MGGKGVVGVEPDGRGEGAGKLRNSKVKFMW